MESGERKTWKMISGVGLVFSIMCLMVCIIQYRAEPDVDIFQKTVRIGINFCAVNFFLFLVFSPLSFWAYATLFYIYGIGSLLDNGNILGTLCIALAFLFLNSSGFFRTYKKTKKALLLIPPACSLLLQLIHAGSVHFLMSVMHIGGTGLIFYLAWLLISPKVKKASSLKTEKIISRTEYSERDKEFLERVLNGEKYSKIARLYDVSESTVKARMVELYHHLGVKSRTEFLAFYSGCTFVLGD